MAWESASYGLKDCFLQLGSLYLKLNGMEQSDKAARHQCSPVDSGFPIGPTWDAYSVPCAALQTCLLSVDITDKN